MPYLAQTKGNLIPRSLDRRVKLTDDQRKEIRHSTGSLLSVAKTYGVSKRLVGFIRNPESQERNKQLREARGGWEQYYDKTKHAEYVRNHRRYKHSITIK